MGFNSQGGHLGIITQTDEGVYSDPGDTDTPGIFMRLQSGAMGSERTLLTPSPEIGGNRDPASAELGPSSFTATYVAYARMDSLPTLLYGALGDVTDTNAGSGTTLVGTHVIHTADVIPWLSLEEQLGNDGYEVANYTDAKIDTLTLDVTANGYMNVTAAMTAITGVYGATATSLEDQVWDTSPMTVGTKVVVSLAGSPIPAKDIKLEIKNNLDATNFLLGTLFLGSLDEKVRSIQVTITVRPEDSDYLRQAVMGSSGSTTPQGLPTVEAFQVVFETWEVIGTTTTHYTCTIAIPVVVIEPFKPTVSGDDPIENTLILDAFRPVAATDIITCTVLDHRAATA